VQISEGYNRERVTGNAFAQAGINNRRLCFAKSDPGNNNGENCFANKNRKFRRTNKPVNLKNGGGQTGLGNYIRKGQGPGIPEKVAQLGGKDGKPSRLGTLGGKGGTTSASPATNAFQKKKKQSVTQS